MKLTEEQKAIRRQSIGSSDIAAVCGLNPYCSPHEVWLQKRGLADWDGNEATEIGDLIEPVILELYSRRKGCLVQRNTHVVECSARPFLTATPDAFTVDEHGRSGRLIEAKCVGFRSALKWGAEQEGADGVPPWYLAQVTHQMYCTGERVVDVAALLGTELRIYSVAFDQSLADLMIRKATTFWERHVLPGVPPPIDGSDGCREMLKALYPRSRTEPRVADERQIELAEALRDAREAAERAAAQKQEAENRLKAAMGDVEKLEGPDWVLRWKSTKAGTRPFVFVDGRVSE